MPTVKELAAQMSAQFEEAERSNGEKFRKLKDGHPQWMQDVCHAAHGEMMPDDHRYEFIEEACDALAEHDTTDDARDSLEADIYTHELTAWLESRADRYGYVDEYVEENGVEAKGFSLVNLLQCGQHREKEEVFYLLLEVLEKLADEEEPEDES